MNEDFDHVLETAELIEEAAAIASNNVAHTRAGGYKPNLDWYAARFEELQGLVRGLSCELWSLALKYDSGLPDREKPQKRPKTRLTNNPSEMSAAALECGAEWEEIPCD